MSCEDLEGFFCIEEENGDVNENSIGKEDALFVKSEDTLVFALIQWTGHQSASDDKHLLIKSLIKYINWSDVSQEAVENFCLHYPNLTHSSNYSNYKNTLYNI